MIIFVSIKDVFNTLKITQKCESKVDNVLIQPTDVSHGIVKSDVTRGTCELDHGRTCELDHGRTANWTMHGHVNWTVTKYAPMN